MSTARHRPQELRQRVLTPGGAHGDEDARATDQRKRCDREGAQCPYKGCERPNAPDGCTNRLRCCAGLVVSGAKRLAATQAHQQAIATINELFDRLDELTAARDRLTAVAPQQP